MKRHPALVALSRDHHDGLLLAVRLQQGERALERLWSTDPAWQAAEVVRFFHDHLERHFAQEEESLFPLAERYIGETDLVTRLRSEHRELRDLCGKLRTPAGELRDILVAFGALLERHIRAEERELFPLCEERVPETELNQLKVTR